MSKYVYIGPSLRDFGLPRYSVFNDPVPAYVQELCDKSPSLKALLIPVEQLAVAKECVGDRGDILNLYAGRVARELSNA